MSNKLEAFIPRVVSVDGKDSLLLKLFNNGTEHNYTVVGYSKRNNDLILNTDKGDVVVTDNYIETDTFTITHTAMLQHHTNDIVNYLDNGTKLSTWSVNTLTDGDDVLHIDPYFDYVFAQLGDVTIDGMTVVTEGNILTGDINVLVNEDGVEYRTNDEDEFTKSKLKGDLLIRTSLYVINNYKSLVVFGYQYQDVNELVTSLEEKDDHFVITTEHAIIYNYARYCMITKGNTSVILNTYLEDYSITNTYNKEFANIMSSSCNRETLVSFITDGKVFLLRNDKLKVYPIESYLRNGYKIDTDVNIDLEEFVIVDGMDIPFNLIQGTNTIIYDKDDKTKFYYLDGNNFEVSDNLTGLLSDDECMRYMFPVTKELLAELANAFKTARDESNKDRLDG